MCEGEGPTVIVSLSFQVGAVKFSEWQKEKSRRRKKKGKKNGEEKM